jgi:hypothetical protein
MASDSDKQWLSDVPDNSPMWGGHNGPSGPTPEAKVIDISKWPTLHNMTEKAQAMYKVFCQAREETRATAEGQANAAEFHQVGKEQGEKIMECLEEVAKGSLTG